MPILPSKGIKVPKQLAGHAANVLKPYNLQNYKKVEHVQPGHLQPDLRKARNVKL